MGKSRRPPLGGADPAKWVRLTFSAVMNRGINFYSGETTVSICVIDWKDIGCSGGKDLVLIFVALVTMRQYKIQIKVLLVNDYD